MNITAEQYYRGLSGTANNIDVALKYWNDLDFDGKDEMADHLEFIYFRGSVYAVKYNPKFSFYLQVVKCLLILLSKRKKINNTILRTRNWSYGRITIWSFVRLFFVLFWIVLTNR